MKRAVGISAVVAAWLVAIVILIVFELYAWALIVQAVVVAGLAVAWVLEASRNRVVISTSLRNVRRAAESSRQYADSHVERSRHETEAIRAEMEDLTRQVRALQSLVKTSDKKVIDGDFLATLDDGLSRLGVRMLKLEKQVQKQRRKANKSAD